MNLQIVTIITVMCDLLSTDRGSREGGEGEGCVFLV